MSFHVRTRVVANDRIAQDTGKVRIDAPELAARIRPGQFVMLRLGERTDPLLGRPFALYDVVGDGIEVVYLAVGKMTRRLLEARPGEPVEVWGPLGNGFDPLDGVKHVGLVAGGIGQTPFLAYARQLLGQRGYGGEAAKKTVERVTLFWGARSRAFLYGRDEFRAAGGELLLATDDGSEGHRGYVTQLLERSDLPDHLVGCGPEPMLHALRAVAARARVPCQVSLETPMACGVGVCFSCVVKVKTDDGWDYKRCCVDGPVFDAAKLVWE